MYTVVKSSSECLLLCYETHESSRNFNSGDLSHSIAAYNMSAWLSGKFLNLSFLMTGSIPWDIFCLVTQDVNRMMKHL